jgi:molybdenum cofactor biosynthesis enzyme MoaA
MLLAQAAQELQWWHVILSDALIPLLVLVATPFLMMLTRRAVDAVDRYLELKWTESQKRQFDEIVLDAIAYAEEQGRKAVKGEKVFEEFTNAKKIEIAITYARKRAEELGLCELHDTASENLAERIEAKLFKERAKARGLKPDEDRLVKIEGQQDKMLSSLDEISEAVKGPRVK